MYLQLNLVMFLFCVYSLFIGKTVLSMVAGFSGILPEEEEEEKKRMHISK